MELADFVVAVERLTGDDIRLVAKALDAETLADEVDWWRATIAIDRALRHTRSTRDAARAAARVVELVQARAVVAGCVLPDDDVTRVARAAAEIARGLVAGRSTRPIVVLLLQPWASVVPVV
jgi:hypothetical protein